MRELGATYRRLFAEYAFGEYPELYINSHDGVLLNFLGLDAVDSGGEILGASPVGDHLSWVNQYEACDAADDAGDADDAEFSFSSNLYVELEGDELTVCGRATSVRWFTASVWPLVLHHAEDGAGAT